MPQRRTEVVIKIKPEIDWSELEDHRVGIRIHPEAEGPAAPAGGAGGELSDLLTGFMGGAATGRIMAGIRTVGAAITALAPYMLIVAAAVVAVVVAFGGMIAQGWLAVKVLKQVGKVGMAGLRLLWEGVKKAGEGFVWLAQTAIQLSIDALEKFIGGVIKLGAAVSKHVEGFIRRAVSTFADFEQSIANTVTVMGKFGAEGMAMRKVIGDTAKALTISSRIMAVEAADAMYTIGSAGFDTAQKIRDLTKAAIMLAEATLVPVKEAAETLMATVLQFGLGAAEATRVANVLAAAISKSPALMDKLRQSLEYAGPVAAGLGIKLEKVVAALMAMYKAGRTGARAGTEMRIVLAALVAPTTKAIKALSKFDIVPDMIDPTRRSLVEIVQVFERLSAEIGRGETVKALRKAFSVRAWSGLVALLTIGSQEMQRMGEAITGTNVAFQMQQDQLLTLSGFWAKVVSIWENVYYDVIEGALSPALKGLLKIIRELIAQARETGAFQIFGEALAYVVDMVAWLVQKHGPYLLEFLTAMAISFGELLPAAVKAFIGVLRQLEQPIKEFLQSLPSIVKAVVEGVIPALVKLATSVFPLLLYFAVLVLPKLAELFAVLADVVADFISKNRDELINWFKILFATAIQLVQTLPQLLPIVKQLAASFLHWAPIIAELAINNVPLLVYAAYTLIGVLNQLATTVLPVFVAGLQVARPLLYAFASVLSAIVGLLQRFGALAIALMPTVASIIMKAMNIGIAVLWAFGDALVSLGPLIFKAAAWLDQNFYQAVAITMDIVAELAGALSVLLLGAFALLTTVLYMTILPAVYVLAAAFAILQIPLYVAVRLVWLFVEGLKALGLIKTTGFELALEQLAGGIEDSWKLTWRLIRGLGYDLPNAVKKYMPDVQKSLGITKSGFDDMADAARQYDQQQKATGRGGYGIPATGNGYGGTDNLGPILKAAADGATKLGRAADDASDALSGHSLTTAADKASGALDLLRRGVSEVTSKYLKRWIREARLSSAEFKASVVAMRQAATIKAVQPPRMLWSSGQRLPGGDEALLEKLRAQTAGVQRWLVQTHPKRYTETSRISMEKAFEGLAKRQEAATSGIHAYQIGPFYVNNADEMRAIFDRQYRGMKQDEEQAGRLRAGGRY